MHEPLGDKRRKQIEAAGVSEVPPGSIPSSYFYDKDKRAEWVQAVKEGREEQLRIENWMREHAGSALKLEGKAQ
jgi:NADH-quinone oxidoreductase subunit B